MQSGHERFRGAKLHRHSEERSDEESGAGFVHCSLDPPPQAHRITQETKEARRRAGPQKQLPFYVDQLTGG